MSQLIVIMCWLLLQISAETCYSLAIKNEFATHPKDISIDSIIEIISKIDDITVAISAAKWAIKQLKSPENGNTFNWGTEFN